MLTACISCEVRVSGKRYTTILYGVDARHVPIDSGNVYHVKRPFAETRHGRKATTVTVISQRELRDLLPVNGLLL